MKIEVTSRRNGVPDRVKAYAQVKAARLGRFLDRVRRIHVVLDQVHDERKAEMVVHVDTGAPMVAVERNGDMFAAIDLVVDKLERQLTRHKQKLMDRNRPRGRAARESPPLP